MMSDIKSAFEIAMEKVDKIGKASEEERLQWKYAPEGEKLGARFLRDDIDLVAEINKLEPAAVKYVTSGVLRTLTRNIAIPKSEILKKNNKRAMDGIKLLKKDKVKVENIFSQIKRLFNHYSEQGEQQRRQAYQQVKAAFEAKVQQALQQQMGSTAGMKIDVEKQPQFQEEWRKVQNQLDGQYLQLLEGFIQELMAIP
jgi:hypothetical protein